MDIDQILKVLAHHKVDYMLIGGVNFLLHHAAELTFDVECLSEARRAKTTTGAPYVGLSDRHMLISQEALNPEEKKGRILERIQILKKAL